MIDVKPNKKEDLRVVRTKKSLTDALFGLLAEREYANISVLEICEAANIHRATFYKHFKDKDEFIKFLVFDIVSRFDVKDDCPGGERFVECYMTMLEELFNYLTENRDLFRLLLQRAPNALIAEKLYLAINKMVIQKFENNAQNGRVHAIPKEVISAYFTGAFISLLKWWIVSDNPYDKDEMKDYMRILIQEPLETIVEGISQIKN